MEDWGNKVANSNTEYPSFALILGGAKSGKSCFAKAVAQNFSTVVYASSVLPELQKILEKSPAEHLFAQLADSKGESFIHVAQPDVVQKMLASMEECSELAKAKGGSSSGSTKTTSASASANTSASASANTSANTTTHLLTRVVVFDSTTLWLAHALHGGVERYSAAQLSGHLKATTEELFETLKQALLLGFCVIVVSSEVGLGVVPDGEAGRIFRNCLGRINIELAKKSQIVLNLTVGIPSVVKAQGEFIEEVTPQSVAHFLQQHGDF